MSDWNSILNRGSKFFKNNSLEEYSKPYIIPKGKVIFKHNSYLWALDNNNNVIPSISYNQYPWENNPSATSIPDNAQSIIIEGDVIVLRNSNHYFHFFFESMIMLEALKISGTLSKYPNPTILCTESIFWNGPRFIRELLEIFDFKIFLMKNMIYYNPGVLYEITGDLIMPKLNNYHDKNGILVYWNKLLIRSLRQRLSINPTPLNYLYISRGNERRRVISENILLENLNKIHDFNCFNPGDLTVYEQQLRFKDASVVISPHGACLTNMLFSNWDKVILIELSGLNHTGSFKPELEIPNHYVIWVNNDSDLNLVFNPIKLSEIIRKILCNENLEDFIYKEHNHFKFSNMLQCID